MTNCKTDVSNYSERLKYEIYGKSADKGNRSVTGGSQNHSSGTSGGLDYR